jgi:hypothetical protein
MTVVRALVVCLFIVVAAAIPKAAVTACVSGATVANLKAQIDTIDAIDLTSPAALDQYHAALKTYLSNLRNVDPSHPNLECVKEIGATGVADNASLVVRGGLAIVGELTYLWSSGECSKDAIVPYASYFISLAWADALEAKEKYAATSAALDATMAQLEQESEGSDVYMPASANLAKGLAGTFQDRETTECSQALFVTDLQ